jgi:hypothetical protein
MNIKKAVLVVMICGFTGACAINTTFDPGLATQVDTIELEFYPRTPKNYDLWTAIMRNHLGSLPLDGVYDRPAAPPANSDAATSGVAQDIGASTVNQTSLANTGTGGAAGAVGGAIGGAIVGAMIAADERKQAGYREQFLPSVAHIDLNEIIGRHFEPDTQTGWAKLNVHVVTDKWAQRPPYSDRDTLYIIGSWKPWPVTFRKSAFLTYEFKFSALFQPQTPGEGDKVSQYEFLIEFEDSESNTTEQSMQRMSADEGALYAKSAELASEMVSRLLSFKLSQVGAVKPQKPGRELFEDLGLETKIFTHTLDAYVRVKL